MTNKGEVDLNRYRKSPRLLAEPMERALGTGGELNPILVAVANDPLLRLDIRTRRFNVYYCGGSLMTVKGCTQPWVAHFDGKYFNGGRHQQPDLPPNVTTEAEARKWVGAFPALRAGMDDWWTRHPKTERDHCQSMAQANAGRVAAPGTDYIVLDLEYQWAQRRVDLVAAKRKPTETDAAGWTEPDLVFIEVKSCWGTCIGKSGLANHASDYHEITRARAGRCVQDIKREFERMVAQKTRLGLLDKSLGFRKFSSAIPQFLIVFVDLDPNESGPKRELDTIRAVANSLGATDRICLMRLKSDNCRMHAVDAVPLQQFVAGIA